METTIENNRETTIVCRGYIGIMENRMQTTMQYSRVYLSSNV